MATSQIQTLLRFLSQDAKIPLATAMGNVNELVKADLTTYASQTLETFFGSNLINWQT